MMKTFRPVPAGAAQSFARFASPSLTFPFGTELKFQIDIDELFSESFFENSIFHFPRNVSPSATLQSIHANFLQLPGIKVRGQPSFRSKQRKTIE